MRHNYYDYISKFEGNLKKNTRDARYLLQFIVILLYLSQLFIIFNENISDSNYTFKTIIHMLY